MTDPTCVSALRDGEPPNYKQLDLAVDALGSISRNNCCGGCQEAKLVAQAALSTIAALRPSEGPETKK